EAGRLAVDVELAAQMIMSANVGVALSLVTQPDRYAHEGLSRRVRDAVHRDLLADGAPAAARAAGTRLTVAANQLAALLAAEHEVPLTAAERALLDQWLATLAGARAA